MDYKDWLAYKSRIEGRDVSQDEHDYDLPAYFNTLKATPQDGGHLSDTFKKPNHPTFSDQSKYHVPVIQQGGSWTGDEQNGFKFTPSELNKQNMGRANLQSYFNEVETPEGLNLPSDELASKARMEALRKISSGE
jgi:hypothetical protein